MASRLDRLDTYLDEIVSDITWSETRHHMGSPPGDDGEFYSASMITITFASGRSIDLYGEGFKGHGWIDVVVDDGGRS